MNLLINRCVLLSFLLFFIGIGMANAHTSTKAVGNLEHTLDTIRWMRIDSSAYRNKTEYHKKRKTGYKFNDIDTSYIEPQRYNFTTMLQNTNTYEVYRIASDKGQSITFAPEANIRIGPYFGWRWIFLGYTVDITHLLRKINDKRRQEYDLSLYSSMLGIDIYYRRTGNDYKIRQLYLGETINTDPIKGAGFDGLTSSIKGFNIYYIFNHRRFSYPAAFSQSTIQRRSAGSPLLGIGYTRHTLEVDWKELNNLVANRLGGSVAVDSTLMFDKIKYTDVSVSGGYAYNWVFAHNWLLASSLSVALAYKQSSGDVTHKRFSISDFKFNNINIDGIGRFGLVWNNSKWYAGMSMILHAYNYRRSNFSTNNFFGSVNLYVGFNFGKRKAKKKEGYQEQKG